MRYRFGNVTYCEPSRFIDEIDDRYVDYPEEPVANPFANNLFDKFRNSYDDIAGNEKGHSDFKETQNGNTINFNPKPKKLISINSRLSTSAFAPVDSGLNRSLRQGDLVMHEKFGRGQITFLDGVWPETKATIEFEKAGSKNLLLKFARLTKP